MVQRSRFLSKHISDKKKEEREKEVRKMMKQMENKYKPCHILPMIYKHGTKEVMNHVLN